MRLTLDLEGSGLGVRRRSSARVNIEDTPRGATGHDPGAYPLFQELLNCRGGYERLKKTWRRFEKRQYHQDARNLLSLDGFARVVGDAVGARDPQAVAALFAAVDIDEAGCISWDAFFSHLMELSRQEATKDHGTMAGKAKSFVEATDIFADDSAHAQKQPLKHLQLWPEWNRITGFVAGRLKILDAATCDVVESVRILDDFGSLNALECLAGPFITGVPCLKGTRDATVLVMAGGDLTLRVKPVPGGPDVAYRYEAPSVTTLCAVGPFTPKRLTVPHMPAMLYAGHHSGAVTGVAVSSVLAGLSVAHSIFRAQAVQGDGGGGGSPAHAGGRQGNTLAARRGAEAYPVLKPQCSVQLHRDSITAMRLIPHTHKLLTCSLDHRACIVDASLPHLPVLETFLGHRNGIYCMDVSTEHQMIVTAGSDCVPFCWSITGGARVGPQPLRDSYCPHAHTIVDAHFIPDSPAVVTLDQCGTFKVWDVRMYLPIQTFTASKTNQPSNASFVYSAEHDHIIANVGDAFYKWRGSAPKKSLGADEHPIVAVALAGTRALTAVQRRVKVWDVQTGALVSHYTQMSPTEIKYMVADANGKKFYLAHYETGVVTVHNVWTGEVQQRVRPPGRGSPSEVCALYCAKALQCLVVGYDDTTVHLWGEKDGEKKVIRTTRAHARPVKAIEGARDWLATADARQVCVWGVGVGEFESITTITPFGPMAKGAEILCICVLAEISCLAVADTTSHISLWAVRRARGTVVEVVRWSTSQTSVTTPLEPTGAGGGVHRGVSFARVPTFLSPLKKRAAVAKESMASQQQEQQQGGGGSHGYLEQLEQRLKHRHPIVLAMAYHSPTGSLVTLDEGSTVATWGLSVVEDRAQLSAFGGGGGGGSFGTPPDGNQQHHLPLPASLVAVDSIWLPHCSGHVGAGGGASGRTTPRRTKDTPCTLRGLKYIAATSSVVTWSEEGAVTFCNVHGDVQGALEEDPEEPRRPWRVRVGTATPPRHRGSLTCISGAAVGRLKTLAQIAPLLTPRQKLRSEKTTPVIDPVAVPPDPVGRRALPLLEPLSHAPALDGGGGFASFLPAIKNPTCSMFTPGH